MAPKFIASSILFLKVLIIDLKDLSSNMKPTLRRITLIVETCSVYAILGLISTNKIYNTKSQISFFSIKTVLNPLNFPFDMKLSIKTFLEGISEMCKAICLNKSTALIDIWLRAVFWTPFLQSTKLFYEYLFDIRNENKNEIFKKYSPLVAYIKLNIQEIFTCWIIIFSSSQLHSDSSGRLAFGIKDFFAGLLLVFNDSYKLENIPNFELYFEKIKKMFPDIDTSSLREVKEDNLVCHLFTNRGNKNRFVQAFISVYIYINSNYNTKDFLYQIDQSTFKTFVPIMSVFLSSLGKNEISGNVDKSEILKTNSRLLTDFNRCILTLQNDGMALKAHARVNRLNEINILRSVFICEMSRALSDDDIKSILEDFILKIMNCLNKSSQYDWDDYNVLRYFPMYIRAISLNAFSTRISTWRCLLFKISQINRRSNDSKSIEFIQIIIIITIVSLCCPFTISTRQLVDMFQIDNLSVFKLIQLFKDHSISDSNLIDNTCFNYLGQNSKSNINSFSLYILFDENSFLSSITDSNELINTNYKSCVYTQSLMKMNYFRLFQLLNNKFFDSDKAYLPLVSLYKNSMIDDINKCLVLDEQSILSLIASVSYFTSILFRLLWGESPQAIVNSAIYNDSSDCFDDILKNIFYAEDIFIKLTKFSINEIYVWLDNYSKNESILSEVLYCWKKLMKSFCEIILSEKESKIFEIEDFYTSFYNLQNAYKSKCTYPNKLENSSVCSSTCLSCKVSFYTLKSIDETLISSQNRINVLNGNNKFKIVLKVHDYEYIKKMRIIFS